MSQMGSVELLTYRFLLKGDRFTTSLGGDCSILLSYRNKGIFKGDYSLKINVIFRFHS